MKYIIRSAGIIFIISIVLGMIFPCQASDINIVGTVTPTSGKEGTNFTYSATITFSKGNLDINNALNIELIISDNNVNKSFTQSGKFQGNGLSPEELIRGRSDPYTFGSYNLGREGLKNVDQLSYEFVLTTGSKKELARNKYPGPKIVIPPEFQSIQYSKTPVYYFQEYPIILTFNDKPSVIPTLTLSLRGPLNSPEEVSRTEDLSAKAVGTTFTFSDSIDLTQFRKGGNFSFNFTYDDSRANEGYAPITGGPYYFTIRPYSPKIVEPIGLAKQIEYNNFTLRAFVEDEGKVLMGDPVGSSASLIIDHPTKGEMIFNNSVPTLQGKYLVFEWDKNSVLFEKSDVLQSKIKPLQAHLRYWNENRNYGANSSNYSFTLVNVTPLLTETHDSVLHMTGDKTALQKVRAFITYAKGMGDLKIVATGPGGRYENILKGSPAGVNKYEYDWSLPFNKSQAGNYNLSFTYIHNSLESGFYEFEQKPEYSFQVVPIYIEFQNGNISPSHGRWNSSYSYTVEVNSSVEADGILQVFNPCSSEWMDAGGVRKIKTGASNISWKIQPFAYDCDELNSGKYRFRANFLGRDFSSTRVYVGPLIEGRDITLISLDYQPVLYVSKDRSAYQDVRATVDSPFGRAKMALNISGPGKSFDQINPGISLGGMRYMYTWSVPFSTDNAGNHTISLAYLQSGLKNGSYAFPDQFMTVVYDDNVSADEPKLIGDLNYTPVLFVSPDKGANQAFNAKIYSPNIKGVLRLNISGKDKNKQIQMNVKDLGGNIYEYDGMESFYASNADNSYRISLDYLLGSRRYSFGDRIMQVALVGTNPTLMWEPGLVLEYDPTVYVPAEGTAEQLIHATILYPSPSGELWLNLSGPNKSLQKVLNGSSLGGNRTLYTANIAFDESNANNSYTISLAYIGSGLAGGDYRFTDHYMRVLRAPEETQYNRPVTDDQTVSKPTRGVIVVGNGSGNVSPAKGAIQEWDERDSLNELTYSLQLKNSTPQEVPWVTLVVKPLGIGSSWKAVGEKKKYDPSAGNVSWTIKPFWDAPFLGTAEYKFLIDDMESQTFKGPEIIARYKAADNWTGQTHNFLATVNASTNLSVCLMEGDNSLPENIKKWKPIGDRKKYVAGNGEQNISWQVPQSRPLYYDFDIQMDDVKVL